MAGITEVHTQVILHKKSSIPADIVVNSWNWRCGVSGSAGDDPNATVLTDIASRISTFYGDIAAFLGSSIKTGTGAVELRHYNVHDHLDGSLVGPPFATDAFNLIAVGTNSLPDELSIVVSYQAGVSGIPEFGPGRATRPRARRRGRLFLGPIAQGSLSEDSTTHEVFVSSTYRSSIATSAGTALKGTTNGTTSAVWSRTDAEMHDVLTGWVDNAFDIQRRRGQLSTARSTF